MGESAEQEKQLVDLSCANQKEALRAPGHVQDLSWSSSRKEGVQNMCCVQHEEQASKDWMVMHCLSGSPLYGKKQRRFSKVSQISFVYAAQWPIICTGKINNAKHFSKLLFFYIPYTH